MHGYVLAALVSAFAPAYVAAQAPADVRITNAIDLPAPPAGFRVEQDGPVTWVFPDSAAQYAHDLRATRRAAWMAIETDLGVDVDDRIEIRIARGPEELLTITPHAAPPPAYAEGVAYPSIGLIAIALYSPTTRAPIDAPRVLTHELSHIALHRAVRNRPIPRWLSEGLAVEHAGEARFSRGRILIDAGIRNGLIPLRALNEAFSSRPHEVTLAYAQSASLVEYLRATPPDAARFRAMVERVGQGERFEGAMAEAYGASLTTLEHEWRARARERYSTLPLVVSSGLLTLAMLSALALAWRRRRRVARATERRWAEEERAAEDPGVLVYDATDKHPPPIPTVEHEGERYTVH